MLKKIFVVLITLVVFVKADLLDDKLQNILGLHEYTKHTKLLNLLFEKKEEFYIGESLRTIKVLETLKDNGLLNLKFNKPDTLTVDFYISDNKLKSLKILNETLKSLGYYYYFTKRAVYTEGEEFLWTITLKAEAAIDPVIFLKELKKSEVFVKDLSLNALNHWQYRFDTKNGKISNATLIEPDEKIVFDKPLDSYLIKIKDVNTLKVISRKLNRWYPYIIFYDDKLNVLKTIEKQRIYKGIKTSVPQDTVYIKIGDMYNLINIKRGLSVIVQNIN